MNKFTYKAIRLLSVSLLVLSLNACFDSDNDKVIEEPNVAPVASDIDLITQTETTIQDNLPASDANGDMLSYAIVSQPNLGILSISNDGQFSYTPNAEITGTDSFTFSVSDGVAAAVTATVSITIETLQVSFADASRSAFAQSPTDNPLSVNGRDFVQDVSAQSDYQDLIDNN